MARFLLLACLLLLPVRAGAQPLADYHQHLFSPTLASLLPATSTAPGAQPTRIPSITAAELIRHLDAAGIRRAVVLSTAYILTSLNHPDERSALMADNDWTAAQVAQFPDRLVGFCGVHPLRSYALDEIARCAASRELRRGLKLHFANSGVNYHDADDIAQLRRVFRAANGYGMALVVHLRPADEKISYGVDEARIFLEQIVPEAPDVDIQIAHLAGSRGNPDSDGERALGFFVDAIAKGDSRAKRLWFDVTAVATDPTTPERQSVIARRIRELGVQRVLYGSDTALPNSLPRDGWAQFRRLPLTEAEFRTIANTVPPYLR